MSASLVLGMTGVTSCMGGGCAVFGGPRVGRFSAQFDLALDLVLCIGLCEKAHQLLSTCGMSFIKVGSLSAGGVQHEEIAVGVESTGLPDM